MLASTLQPYPFQEITTWLIINHPSRTLQQHICKSIQTRFFNQECHKHLGKTRNRPIQPSHTPPQTLTIQDMLKPFRLYDK